MVSAEQNRGRTEIIWHLNRVGARQGSRSLKVVPGRKVVAEMEGIPVGVISTVWGVLTAETNFGFEKSLTRQVR